MNTYLFIHKKSGNLIHTHHDYSDSIEKVIEDCKCSNIVSSVDFDELEILALTDDGGKKHGVENKAGFEIQRFDDIPKIPKSTKILYEDLKKK